MNKKESNNIEADKSGMDKAGADTKQADQREAGNSVLPPGRMGRAAFAFVICVSLLMIGRNLYRHDLYRQLVVAVEANDAAAVRSLLNRGATANEKSGSSILDRAFTRLTVSKEGQVIRLLIERGALRGATTFAKSEYLETACQNGSVAVVRCLLEHGANPRFAIPGHDATLTYAVSYGLYSTHNPLGANYPRTPEQEAQDGRISREMIALLRQHGAQITPLMAVELANADLLRESLASGANVNERDQNGRTALHVAAQAGDVPLMQILLAHGADVNAASFGTPLAMAAEAGHQDAVELLLARGANVNLAGKYYASPLLAAVKAQYTDIARLLLAQGANPNQEPGAAYLGGTALSFAAQRLPAVVPDLLARGADVNGADGLALQSALRAHDADMARVLLAHGARCYPALSKSVSTTAYDGPAAPDARHALLLTTPSTLTLAVTNAPECFDLLIRAGADITPDKPDILLAAARAGQAALFARLIALGANVNALDRQGKTPLTEAILHAPAGVQTLLEHGANPNIITQPVQTTQKLISQPGQTPLILAARSGNAFTVRLLVAHRADINARPLQGHTALYYARQHGKAEIVKILEQAGARDE